MSQHKVKAKGKQVGENKTKIVSQFLCHVKMHFSGNYELMLRETRGAKVKNQSDCLSCCNDQGNGTPATYAHGTCIALLSTHTACTAQTVCLFASPLLRVGLRHQSSSKLCHKIALQ